MYVQAFIPGSLDRYAWNHEGQYFFLLVAVMHNLFQIKMWMAGQQKCVSLPLPRTMLEESSAKTLLIPETPIIPDIPKQKNLGVGSYTYRV